MLGVRVAPPQDMDMGAPRGAFLLCNAVLSGDETTETEHAALCLVTARCTTAYHCVFYTLNNLS